FGVPLPQRLQLRGQPGLDGLPAQGAQAERHEENPDRHRERDDRGHGGQAAENGSEDTGESGDEVVRGVHRDAKETRHETTAFQLRRDEGWRRPRGPQVSEKCAGQRETAAAGAADGALGLDRPAASGSRWRRNAARQDFSRSAETRRIIGRAAVARETPATEVSRASTAAKTAPARMAPASAVSPDGLTASCVRSRSNPASMASRLPSTVIAIVPSWAAKGRRYEGTGFSVRRPAPSRRRR